MGSGVKLLPLPLSPLASFGDLCLGLPVLAGAAGGLASSSSSLSLGWTSADSAPPLFPFEDCHGRTKR